MLNGVVDGKATAKQKFVVLNVRIELVLIETANRAIAVDDPEPLIDVEESFNGPLAIGSVDTVAFLGALAHGNVIKLVTLNYHWITRASPISDSTNFCLQSSKCS